jgi:hypothetical protein
VQVRAPVARDARVQDLVVAALDDMDRVDLDVAEVANRGRGCLSAVAERRPLVEPLRAKPEPPGARRG